MPRAELAGYLEFAHRTAQRAGEAILPHFRRAIEVQDKRNFMGYDPVTVADHAAEQVIRDAIKAAYPTHGIHGEEHGRETGTSALTWVIDPIDGTKSFILGQLHWGVLIALHDGHAPVVGVAHQPFVGETFTGYRGRTCAMAPRRRNTRVAHAFVRLDRVGDRGHDGPEAVRVARGKACAGDGLGTSPLPALRRRLLLLHPVGHGTAWTS